ncbi:hypothetical protein [Actinokineospora spheciospongiae]|uniref:hypothetical protein n=1 Tax=Actinokineospora spheciospongiae TaxID=909613 RepID=UPI000D880A6D|nr:hypothetical protein [Actinokineospora spheciospongiae]PWW63291.1 hypothetical protein DFQ13_104281 [Actinokineospora spheciospongiae]
MSTLHTWLPTPAREVPADRDTDQLTELAALAALTEVLADVDERQHFLDYLGGAEPAHLDHYRVSATPLAEQDSLWRAS